MNDFVGLPRPTGINMQGDFGIVQYGDDSRLVVFFYTKSVHSPAKSREAGTPQYQNETWVRMHPPGERLNIVDRPVLENDKFRFPIQWSRFLQQQEQRPDGTPIDLLFPNNPAVADNLKTYGIYTVQQLANLSADAIQNVGMGAQEYVNMANRYIENGKDGTGLLAVQEQLKKSQQNERIQEQRITELQSTVNALMQQMKNPLAAGTAPGWVPNADAAVERLDANHPSVEIAAEHQKKAKKRA